MATTVHHPLTLSVSEANARGVSGLVKQAEEGADVVVERHGRPVAVVVSKRHFDDLRALEGELRDAALIIMRAADDSGVRAPLDEALAAFGFDRAELESDLDADLDVDVE